MTLENCPFSQARPAQHDDPVPSFDDVIALSLTGDDPNAIDGYSCDAPEPIEGYTWVLTWVEDREKAGYFGPLSETGIGNGCHNVEASVFLVQNQLTFAFYWADNGLQVTQDDLWTGHHTLVYIRTEALPQLLDMLSR